MGKTFVIVGPDVVRNFASGYEYARKLQEIKEKVADKMNVAMWVSCKLSEDEENNRRLQRRFVDTVRDHIGIQCFNGEPDSCVWVIRESEFTAAKSRIMAIYSGL